MPSEQQAPRGGNVLIVEDESDYAERFIARPFRADFALYFAYNVPGALALVDRLPQLSLALVDLDLPGGTPFDPTRAGGFGFEVVERVRARFPAAHTVVLTAHVHPTLINTSQRLGADYLVKTDCSDNLRGLARRVLATRHGVGEQASRFLAEFVRAHALTKRQAEVLALFLTGRSHAEIAQELGISANTLKRHVRDILAASSMPSLAGIVRRFWRETSVA